MEGLLHLGGPLRVLLGLSTPLFFDTYTQFHLNLTFLKPSPKQCVFLMEMFFLNYVNCICFRICL